MTARGELVETDTDFLFPTGTGVSIRLLRVWRVDPDTLICVVTERAADHGMSITNAAGQVIVELERRYPHAMVRVVEHYPDTVDGIQFSWAFLGAGGRPQWRYLPDDEARQLLPGVEELP